MTLRRCQSRRSSRRSRPELQWVLWLSTDELIALENIYRVASHSVENKLSEADELAVFAIYADAARRMTAGWPSYDADPTRYREADARHQRDGTLCRSRFGGETQMLRGRGRCC